ncbi:hypothetical protein WDR88_003887 [Enterobacter cloacae]|nr:hypothetical protein [Enterobacter cloacae]
MNNKELVKSGHELAKAISSDTPLIEIAKMVSNLATQLDVQIARSNQLSIALEAAEKRLVEHPGQKRLIGWRMADYTDETADPKLAKNWATAVDVLPIFEGDINTKLNAAVAGKGE